MEDTTTGKVERLNDVPGVMRIKVCRDKYGNYQGTLAPRDHTNIVSYSPDELNQFKNIRYIFRPSDSPGPVGQGHYFDYRPERQDNLSVRARAWKIKTAKSAQYYKSTYEVLNFPPDIFAVGL